MPIWCSCIVCLLSPFAVSKRDARSILFRRIAFHDIQLFYKANILLQRQIHTSVSKDKQTRQVGPTFCRPNYVILFKLLPRNR